MTPPASWNSEDLAVLLTNAGWAWRRGRWLGQDRRRLRYGLWGKRLVALGLSSSAAHRDMRLARGYASASACARSSGDGSIQGAWAALPATLEVPVPDVSAAPRADTESLAIVLTPAGAAWQRGQWLCREKDKVRHGAWRKVLAFVGMSSSAAQRDMRLARGYASASACARSSGDGSAAAAGAALPAADAVSWAAWQAQWLAPQTGAADSTD